MKMQRRKNWKWFAIVVAMLLAFGIVPARLTSSHSAVLAESEGGDAPAQPAQPEAPAEPAAPAEPSEPSKPEAPEEPSEPSQPEEPAASKAPSEPTREIAPESTPTPEHSQPPKVTDIPTSTPTQDATAEPASTSDVTDSSATPNPASSATPDSDTTLQPSASMDPNGTLDPDVTADPAATLDPNATPDPDSEDDGLTIKPKKRYSDWEGVVPTNEQGMPIPILYQTDYPEIVCTIRGIPRSVASSGCGATSASMVIAYLTGDTEQTPYTLFYHAVETGHYNGAGLSHETISWLLKQYGVKGTWIRNDGKAIKKALMEGKPVIAHMGPGIFTRSGHYVVLRGVTSDGKILLNDPISPTKTHRAFPIQTLLTQARNSHAFMICTTDELDAALEAAAEAEATVEPGTTEQPEASEAPDTTEVPELEAAEETEAPEEVPLEPLV